jgi:hypothetical protein
MGTRIQREKTIMVFTANVEKLGPNYKRSGGYAYKISSKASSIIVSECGGRILSIEHRGEEIAWSNPAHFRRIPEILQKGKTSRDNVTWEDVNTLGGGKIQIAPQELYEGKVPFLEPHLGMFTSWPIDGGVNLTSPVCRESKLQIVEKIRMTGPSTFEIQACLINRSKAPVVAAPWLVFQLRLPAVVGLQHLTEAPEAFKVFGEDLPDGVLGSLGRHSFFLSLDPDGKMFKAGYNFSSKGTKARQNITAYFPNENTGLSFEADNITGKFPHGYRGETFGCADYFEQELLARDRYIRFGQMSDVLKVKFTLASIK